MSRRAVRDEAALEGIRLSGRRWLDLRRRGAVGGSAAHWSLDEMAGRVGELSGVGATARLSLAFSLVREAQGRGEPVVWISSRESTFFPPDVAAAGVDLEALPVIFVPDGAAAARAAERLARSGAFGLLVLDLAGFPAGPAQDVPAPLQARLAGLAQRHEAVVLYLTEKAPDAASLGPLVSLRCQALLEAAEPAAPTVSYARWRCRLRVLKDKRRGPGWEHAEMRRAPAGLR
ncbi:MAG: recombinase A [Acidobacteriota bacterium]|nr:recombinase A [Acidobacteriota bacterium]